MKDCDKCTFKGYSHSIGELKDAPKFIRCPKCNRRLKPRFSDCHYEYAEPCWHYSIPPHKVKGWWKKPKKKSKDIKMKRR